MPRLALAALLCAAASSAVAAPPSQVPAPPAATQSESGDPVTCTGKLSGSVKGGFTCKVQVAVEGDLVTFKVEVLDAVPGVKTLVPADFELLAPLRPQAYGRDAVKAGTAVVELANGDRYTASGRRGHVAIDLTSAERYKHAPGFYVVSGTLTAHLVADGKALGEVVLELKF